MSRRIAATTLALSTLLGIGALATASPASAGPCQPESCPQPSPVCVLLDRVHQNIAHCIPVY